MLKSIEQYIKKKKSAPEGFYLRVKVNPKSAKSGFTGLMEDETLKIDIAAPPEKGKANKELARFLSREFAVSKENISIISGAAEKLKLIKIKTD